MKKLTLIHSSGAGKKIRFEGIPEDLNDVRHQIAKYFTERRTNYQNTKHILIKGRKGDRVRAEPVFVEMMISETQDYDKLKLEHNQERKEAVCARASEETQNAKNVFEQENKPAMNVTKEAPVQKKTVPKKSGSSTQKKTSHKRSQEERLTQEAFVIQNGAKRSRNASQKKRENDEAQAIMSDTSESQELATEKEDRSYVEEDGSYEEDDVLGDEEDSYEDNVLEEEEERERTEKKGKAKQGKKVMNEKTVKGKTSKGRGPEKSGRQTEEKREKTKKKDGKAEKRGGETVEKRKKVGKKGEELETKEKKEVKEKKKEKKSGDKEEVLVDTEKREVWMVPVLKLPKNYGKFFNIFHFASGVVTGSTFTSSLLLRPQISCEVKTTVNYSRKGYSKNKKESQFKGFSTKKKQLTASKALFHRTGVLKFGSSIEEEFPNYHFKDMEELVYLATENCHSSSAKVFSGFATEDYFKLSNSGEQLFLFQCCLNQTYHHISSTM